MLDETDRAHVTHNTKEEMTKFEAGIIFLVYFVRRSHMHSKHERERRETTCTWRTHAQHRGSTRKIISWTINQRIL